MLDFLVNYLMIDRLGCAVALAVVALVFAKAKRSWQRARPAKKAING